ncbi:MAG: FadR/GntR family transcriptional regulator [Agathobacter sp.]
MEFQKITAPSLRTLFVEQLEHMILSGQLQIGEKLPSERQLAEAMQVSRGVVNGGLSELEKKGFLEVRPRSGTYVADYRRKGTIDTLISIINYHDGIITDDVIRSILELRIALDTLAVQLCIDHITDSDLELLREQVEKIKHATSNHEAAEAAFAFQHEFALLSGNTLIPLVFQTFRPIVISMWERFCLLHGIPALYDNNDKFWAYLKARDKDGAIAWLESFIGETIKGSREIYY